MKKWIALLLTLAMLLSASALGEGMRIAVSNVVISENEDFTDFTGLEGVLYLADAGQAGGVYAGLNYNGQQLGGVTLAMIGTQFLLKMDAGAGRQAAYYLDLGEVLGRLGQQLRYEVLMAALMSDDGDSPAADAASELVDAYFGDCIFDGGTSEIDGVDYATTAINIPPERVRAFVEDAVDYAVASGKITREEADEQLGNLFTMGAEYTVIGTIYEAETNAIYALKLKIDITDLKQSAALDFYCVASENGNGGKLYDLDLAAEAGGERNGVQLTLDVSKYGDVSWVPSDVEGAENVLDLGDMEEIEAALAADFEAFGELVIENLLAAMS